MTYIQKFGFYFLLLAVISEIALPFILANYYPGYNQINDLISVFGESIAPTQEAFKIWEVVNGTLFLLSTPAIYLRFQYTDQRLAFWTAFCVGLFGIGDCIITGLVDRAATTEEVGFSTYFHNYASGAAFVALLVGTFLLIRLYYLEHNHLMVMALPIIFVLSMIFMFLFAMPKIPIISQFQVSHRGLWQRLNLYFLYLPFVLVALGGISRNK